MFNPQIGRPPKIPLHEGMTLGRWTLIRIVRSSGAHRWKWLCRCSCGAQKHIIAQHLRSGASQSCGCLKREKSIARSTTHGACLTPEYKVWAGMMNRCHYGRLTARGGKHFASYRGRGIVSLDRFPDNDGNYEKDNYRWATSKQQRANQRRRISTKTKLASALLTLGHIPHEDAKLMTADQIISLYHFDHYPIMYVIKPIDEPWNLVPRLIQEHRQKTRNDLSVAASVKRLSKAHEDFRRRVLGVKKIKKPKRYRWPKRKMR